jgi:uncharacterized repeat protein (TIGR03803 family)
MSLEKTVMADSGKPENWKTGMRLRTASVILVLTGVLSPGGANARHAAARKFTTLYRFTGGTDGGGPLARVIGDGTGNLYGTTTLPSTVFKLDTHGKETVLHGFHGSSDGFEPIAGLLRDGQGNLYGTTFDGGIGNCDFGSGCGTVFRVSPTGKETVLYEFTGGADGGNPAGGLVSDEAGNLYGTTTIGGPVRTCNDSAGCGVVFKLSKKGKETVLHKFASYPTDGAYPWGDLIRDAAGNLYGTANSGGTFGPGMVFKIDKQGNETMLHAFYGSGDGGFPYGGLVRDAKGNLYGATFSGGILKGNCSNTGAGCGTVFKIDANGQETVLHEFTGGADGANPYYVDLVLDAAGNLYGTTYYGGDLSCMNDLQPGCGVVFKLDQKGKETVLHRFATGEDGGNPRAGLLRDAKGNLYGTTFLGGLTSGCFNSKGCGTVFKVTP